MTKNLSSQPDEAAAEILLHKLHLVSKNATVGLIATVAAASLLVVALGPSHRLILWLGWWLVMILISMLRMEFARRFFNEEQQHTADPERWLQHYTVLIAFLGVWWAAGAFMFSWQALPDERFLAALVVAAMAAGSISTLAPLIRLYYLYASPMVLAVSVSSFLLPGNDVFDWFFGFVALVYLYGIASSAHYLDDTLSNSIELAISERKLAHELRFANLVYQAIGDAVLITDNQGNILACNEAFEKISGYECSEIVGRNARGLGSGRLDKMYFRHMWQTLASQGHWQGEIYNRRKDGEEYIKWLTINTIRDEHDRPFRHVGLFSDVTDQKRAEELAWREANYDPLTTLPNRRLFHDRLEQEIKHVQRDSLGVALLIIDLDKFNEVNDTLGHGTGDMLLLEAANRLVFCIRASDTLARTGGDEFSVILAEFPDAEHIERIAGSIVEKLRQPFQLGKETVYVSSSIGIAFYPLDAGNADELIKNADQAMFAAKKAGGDRYGFFTNSLQQDALLRRKLINELRNALEANQLRLLFQPIVSLHDKRIFKAETLLRWEHPQFGMVNPADFIPLAEESGLITSIGDWVFREAANWTKRWHDELLPDIQVSINKSAVQFHSPGYSGTWVEYLDTIGLPGECIVIEITESLMLDANPTIAAQLATYRKAGIRLSIDDFGTGYSSLSYLKRFDAHYLKIDQSFVHDLENDPNDRALSEAIVVMSHKLGIKVIAEGVETEGQRDILLEAGCDYGQGYLFSEPITGAQFTDLLKRQQTTAGSQV